MTTAYSDTVRTAIKRYRGGLRQEARGREVQAAGAEKRAAACWDLHELGLSYADIGEIINLTRGRVQQMVEWYRKINAPGGTDG